MRDLQPEQIAAAVKCNPNEAICLILPCCGIGSFGNYSLTNLLIIDFSQNDIQSLEGFFKRFQSAWWINLSHNQVDNLGSETLPRCLGLLDLSGNSLSFDELEKLSASYILRLKIKGNLKITNEEYREEVMTRLPEVWVLDDEYIPVNDINEMKRRQLRTVSPLLNRRLTSMNLSGDWCSYDRANERESQLLNAIQNIPVSSSLADSYRLDILLEDYLNETWIYNKYKFSLGFSGTSMPYVDCVHILQLPHQLRIDLGILLTSTILFDVPAKILSDTLVMMLCQCMPMNAIKDIGILPPFVKTAIVSMIHRICEREQSELATIQHMLTKPVHKISLGLNAVLPIPSFLGSNGFNHLRPFKVLMESELPNPGTFGTSSMDGSAIATTNYSQLELELLAAMPRAPVRSMAPDPFTNSSSYRDWISLVSRHSVLMLTKSPSCPSLTRLQTSKTSQELYKKMLPLLAAAGMRYQDLELSFMGSGKDGRLAIHSKSKKSLVGGEAMEFGAGLPSGGPDGLSWNRHGTLRSYHKPWLARPSTDGEGGEDSPDSNFMPTRMGLLLDNNNYSSATSHYEDENKGMISTDGIYLHRSPSRASGERGLPSKPHVVPSMSEFIMSSPVQPVRSPIASPKRSRPQSPTLRPLNANSNNSINFNSNNSSPPTGEGVGDHPITSVMEEQTPSTLNLEEEFYLSQRISRGSPSHKPTLTTIPSIVSIESVSASIKNDSKIVAANDLNKIQYGQNFPSKAKTVRIAQPMATVGGYSADSLWDSTFLLAPVATVTTFNSHVASQAERWSKIQNAPVILLNGDQEAEEQLATEYLKQTHPAFATHNNYPDSSRLISSEPSTEFEYINDESVHDKRVAYDDKEIELNSSTEIQLSNYASTEDNIFKKVNSRRDVIATGAEDVQESSLQSSHPSSSEEKNNSNIEQEIEGQPGQERTEEMSEALAAVMLLTGWQLRTSGQAEVVLERGDSDTLSIHSSTLGSDDESIVSGIADFTLLAPELKEEVIQKIPSANDTNENDNVKEGGDILKQLSDETGLVLAAFLDQLSTVSDSLSKTIEEGFRRRSITFHSPSASLLVPIKEETENSPRLVEEDKTGERGGSSGNGLDKLLEELPQEDNSKQPDDVSNTNLLANEGGVEGVDYLRKSSLSNDVGLSNEIVVPSSTGQSPTLDQYSASESSSRKSSECLPAMMEILSMPTTPTIFSVVRGPSLPQILPDEVNQAGDRETKERHLERENIKSAHHQLKMFRRSDKSRVDNVTETESSTKSIISSRHSTGEKVEGVGNATSGVGGSSIRKTTSIDTSSEEEAKLVLLREMGTIRNVQMLQESNRKTRKQVKQLQLIRDQRRLERLHRRLLPKALLNTIIPGNSMKEEVKKEIGPISWETLAALDNANKAYDLAAISTKDDSAAFLTTVYGQPEEQEDNEEADEVAVEKEFEQEDESDYQKNRNLETEDKLTAKNDVNIIPISSSNDLELSNDSPLAYTNEQDDILKTLARSVSITQILRQKHQYSKIYSNSRDIELGETAGDGKFLSPTWYPHYEKVIYTVEPSPSSLQLSRTSPNLAEPSAFAFGPSSSIRPRRLPGVKGHTSQLEGSSTSMNLLSKSVVNPLRSVQLPKQHDVYGSNTMRKYEEKNRATAALNAVRVPPGFQGSKNPTQLTGRIKSVRNKSSKISSSRGDEKLFGVTGATMLESVRKQRDRTSSSQSFLSANHVTFPKSPSRISLNLGSAVSANSSLSLNIKPTSSEFGESSSSNEQDQQLSDLAHQWWKGQTQNRNSHDSFSVVSTNHEKSDKDEESVNDFVFDDNILDTVPIDDKVDHQILEITEVEDEKIPKVDNVAAIIDLIRTQSLRGQSLHLEIDMSKESIQNALIKTSSASVILSVANEGGSPIDHNRNDSISFIMNDFNRLEEKVDSRRESKPIIPIFNDDLDDDELLQGNEEEDDWDMGLLANENPVSERSSPRSDISR